MWRVASTGRYPLEGVLDPLVASSGDAIVLLRSLRDATQADAFALAGASGILDLEHLRRAMEGGVVAAGYAMPTDVGATAWRITDSGAAAAAAIDSPVPASTCVREETIRFDLRDGADRPDVDAARQTVAAFGHDLLAEVTDHATREILAESGRDRALLGAVADVLAGVRAEVEDALDLIDERWPTGVTSVVADVERSGWDVTWAARVVGHTSMAEQMGLDTQTIPPSRPMLAEAAKRLRVLADKLDPKSTNPDDTPIRE